MYFSTHAERVGKTLPWLVYLHKLKFILKFGQIDIYSWSNELSPDVCQQNDDVNCIDKELVTDNATK